MEIVENYLCIKSYFYNIIMNLKNTRLKQMAILTILDFKSFKRIKICHGQRPFP